MGKAALTAVFIVMLIFVLVTLNGQKTSAGKYDSFAKCLTEKGAKMYGAFWCPHCQAQKKLFGSSWQYIDYVECSLPDGKGQVEYCTKQGIVSYPVWEFKDGSRTEGESTLAALAEKAGCSLPS